MRMMSPVIGPAIAIAASRGRCAPSSLRPVQVVLGGRNEVRIVGAGQDELVAPLDAVEQREARVRAADIRDQARACGALIVANCSAHVDVDVRSLASGRPVDIDRHLFLMQTARTGNSAVGPGMRAR